MKPFFSRVGGKFRLRKTIVPLIPNHKIYVELFIGAGSIFLYKDKSDKEVINDLDTDIYNIWLDFKAQPELIKKMNFKNNKQKFKRLLNKKKFKNRKERLFRNLYLSFNSYGANRKDYTNTRNISGKSIKENTEAYKERLKNVKIYNKDFRKIIKKYDSKNTFFYLDPPYDDSFNGNYTHETLKIEEVYDAIKNIKGKFLLSYSYQPKLRKLFKNFYIKKIKTTHQRRNDKFGIKNRKITYEVLISNYPLKK